MNTGAELIGGVFPYGVGVVLSPLPVIAVVLLLMAPTGMRRAASFLCARVVVWPHWSQFSRSSSI